MKILSPLPRKRGRLEIIPLIDIMFFLLASFMMVSLTMQQLTGISLNLPTATQAQSLTPSCLTMLTVDQYGQTSLNNHPISLVELTAWLKKQAVTNPNDPVYIQGHRDTLHASMIYVLDLVKRAGIQKVAFSVQPAS